MPTTTSTTDASVPSCSPSVSTTKTRALPARSPTAPAYSLTCARIAATPMPAVAAPDCAIGLELSADSGATACGITPNGASDLRYSAASAARRAVSPGRGCSTPLTRALFHNPKARLAACASPRLCALSTLDFENDPSPTLYARLTIAPSSLAVGASVHSALTRLAYSATASHSRRSATSFVQTVSAVMPSVSPQPQVSLPAGQRYAVRLRPSASAISSTAASGIAHGSAGSGFGFMGGHCAARHATAKGNPVCDNHPPRK